MIKVVAVVPVFNEEKTVKEVLNVLLSSLLIDKVVVVDDGSVDGTLAVLNSISHKKLRIISLKENLGKSGAVKVATTGLKTDLILFCDGDIQNFNHRHVEQLLEPFKEQPMAMSVGLRDYNSVVNFIGLNLFPLVTGERVISHQILKEIINDPLLKNYNLEVILNDYCHKKGIPIYKQVMQGVKHTNKPEKIESGFFFFLKETWEVGLAWIKLKFRWLF